MINILSTELKKSNITNNISTGIITSKIIKGKKKSIHREILGDVATSNSSNTILSIKFAEKN